MGPHGSPQPAPHLHSTLEFADEQVTKQKAVEGLRLGGGQRGWGAAHSMIRSLGLKGDRESRPSRFTTWKRKGTGDRQVTQPTPMHDEGHRRVSPNSAHGASLPCPGLGVAQPATLSPTTGPADHWLPIQIGPTWENTQPRTGTLADFLARPPTVSPHRKTEAQGEELLTWPSF